MKEKVRKDAFLIVRVTRFEKELLLEIATEKGKKISQVVRGMIERYIDDSKAQ
jgi:hypothetical protein